MLQHLNSFFSRADFFTLLRILLAPIVFKCMALQRWEMAGILFVGAAFTDFLDGFVARYYGQETYVGMILDPVADKILMVLSLYGLSLYYPGDVLIPTWFLMFIVIKEALLLIGGACMVVANYSRKMIQPSFISKSATCVQMIMITWIVFGGRIDGMGEVVLYGVFLLQCCVLCGYAMRGAYLFLYEQ